MADAPAATAPPIAVDDWTRVDAGTFHAFHQTFIAQLGLTLTNRLLPPGYYVHPERNYGGDHAGENEGDLLTLAETGAVVGGPADGGNAGGDSGAGGTAVLAAPPAAAVVTDLSGDGAAAYAAKASRLAVRRGLDHRLVALLELASPGNKDRPRSVARLAGKVAEALEDGVHVVLIDLFPPGPHDPAGLHGAVVEELGSRYDPPPGKPLCSVGYRARKTRRAFAEPLAVGDPLPTAPLFLTPDRYVPLPLGPDYAVARPIVGRFFLDVLEGRRPPRA